MSGYIAVNKDILRLTTAYKDIFTTVYLLKTPQGAVLFDAASYDSDIEDHVLPFLEAAGVAPKELKYVFISHNHKDHSGGLARLMAEFPELCIISRSETLREAYNGHSFLLPEDGDMLLDAFRVVTIPGHTLDSSALLDIRTMTLITGDCLQQYGIRGSGDWAANISYPTEHLAALEKVRALGAERIVTAHDYVPCGFQAEGDGVFKMLDACVEPLNRLRSLIESNSELDDGQIRELFSDTQNHLTINVRVVAAMRAAAEKGALV